jgi:alpha-ribazole phosphatase
MTLYLIRHPPVQVDQPTCYGQSEVPLIADWQRDLENLSQLCQNLSTKIEIYSSPLSRCLDLAQYFFDGSIKTDARLLELNFGRWEGYPWDQIPRSELDHWGQDYIGRPVPEGESYLQLLQRISSFLDELGHDQTKTTLVFSHAGVIRGLLSLIYGIRLKQSFAIPIPFASPIEVLVQTDDVWMQGLSILP